MRKIFNPITFQGNHQKKNYFEGWYYKQVSPDERTIISFIPGISLFPVDHHAFVQYIFTMITEHDCQVTKTGYVRYSLDEFHFCDYPFEVRIGKNTFTETTLDIDILDQNLCIHGKIQLGSLKSLNTSIFMPNVMGPFAYIPKMECYHGIISMNHSISGSLAIDKKTIDFNSGKGYLEKDWGSSFPKEYVWIQSNHFERQDTSLFLSIAHIPFLRSSFQGFICVLVLDGQEYRFATYNQSKLTIQKIRQEEVRICLSNRKAKLIIEAYIQDSGELKAPVLGSMKRIVKEGHTGEVRITLTNKRNNIIYEDFSKLAGIEVVSP